MSASSQNHPFYDAFSVNRMGANQQSFCLPLPMATRLPLKCQEWRFMPSVSHLLQAALCTISWPRCWAPELALEWNGVETKTTDKDSTYKLSTDTYNISSKTPTSCPVLCGHHDLCLLLFRHLAPATVFITFLLEQFSRAKF